MTNFYRVLILSMLLTLVTCQRNRDAATTSSRAGTAVGQGRTLGLLGPLLGLGLGGISRPYSDVPIRPAVSPVRPTSGVASDPVNGVGGGYPGYGGGYSGYGGGYGGGGFPVFNIFGFNPFGFGYRPPYGGYGGGYGGGHGGGYGGGYPGFGGGYQGYGGAYQGNGGGYQASVGNYQGAGGGYQGAGVGYQGNFGNYQGIGGGNVGLGGGSFGSSGFGGGSYQGIPGYQQQQQNSLGLGSFGNLASAAGTQNAGGAGSTNAQAALANALGQALGASLRPLLNGGAGSASRLLG